MRIMHISDLHLGYGFEETNKRYNDYFEAFSKIIETAIIENIKIILISGDIFDKSNIKPHIYENAKKIFKKAKDSGLKIITITGNHDQYLLFEDLNWLDILANEEHIIHLKAFKNEENQFYLKELDKEKKEGSIYEDKEIRVVGIGYFRSNIKKAVEDLEDDFKNLKKDKVNILMLHAGIRLEEKDCGIEKDELLIIEKYFDYVALGHLHQKLEYRDKFYNPGTIEVSTFEDFK
jgi:DNA repair exonuclease SbcCD nuclease subunit